MLDEYGRATDCFAFTLYRNRYICAALNNFYNAETFGNEDLCLDCPFYKPQKEMLSEQDASITRSDLARLRTLVKSNNPRYKEQTEELKKPVLKYISGIDNLEIREHMYLYYVKGKTYSEIAATAENVIAADTVAKRIQRQLRFVREGEAYDNQRMA